MLRLFWLKDADTLLISWLTDGDTSGVFYCGGVKMVYKIFDEVQKFPQEYPFARLFMADRDMTLFHDDRTESQKNGVFTTKGYSLENDLYEDAEKFIDEKLVYTTIKEKKKRLFENLSRWFAFEVEDYIIKEGKKETKFKDVKLRHHEISESLNFPIDFLKKRGFFEPKEETYKLILDNHALMIRGHILFRAIAELFAMSNKQNEVQIEHIVGTEVKIKTINQPTYTEEQILLDCYAYAIVSEGSNISRIKSAIENALK
jgi:hypothetical protein